MYKLFYSQKRLVFINVSLILGGLGINILLVSQSQNRLKNSVLITLLVPAVSVEST